MKRTLVTAALALILAMLGGCVVTPYHYRDYDDGGYHHDYYHGDGSYRHHGWGYGDDYGYQDHGS